MKCLILAAGYATRLYPLTENFPKPLLKVGEKSILDWLVDDLVDSTDIDEFVVISNHKFAQHFENWKNNKQKTRPYEVTVIDDGTSTNETRLGAVKDIQLAVEKLNLADDLLVMAGDNVLDFSLSKFVEFAKEKNTSCVMCHEENELKKQQKTAIITLDGNDLITSYEEKPTEPKGNLAVPPFYCYCACDVKRIQEALENGCGYDAPGSFAAWLSKQTPICTDKSKLDMVAAKKKIEKSLKNDYYMQNREWPYKNVKRRIIAEEYMVDESGYELKDYKIFAFDGEAKAMFIASDRTNPNEETKFDFFDMDFNHLPFTNGHPNSKEWDKIKRPKGLDEMKKYAEILSKGLPEARIDFYDINGKVYFGEITFFHWSGFERFDPAEWDEKFGEWIKLPQK